MPQAPSPWRTRLLVLAISCAAAGLLLWGGLRWKNSRAPKALEIRRTVLPTPTRPADDRDLSEIFGDPPNPTRPEEWAFYLPKETAGIFFGFGEFSEYDPWTYARPREKHDVVMPWPEHPDGKMVSNTNSIGCRETHELAVPPADLRVLVAGDSHTFGVCNDDEVVTERLEVALRARRPGRSIEVLNAASGGYSFLNYIGTWFRMRDFHPQLFLVIVFAGNDFGELLGPSLHFSARPWPSEAPGRNDQRNAMLAADPYAMAQGLDSVESNRSWPEERERNVRDALYLCRQMKRFAEEGGSKFAVALLPSPFLLKWPDEATKPGRKAVDGFGLKPADFEREQARCTQFLDGLGAAGIDYLDLTTAFAKEPSPPYWHHDLHLSSHGHDVAAQALLPFVEPRLPR